MPPDFGHWKGKRVSCCSWNALESPATYDPWRLRACDVHDRDGGRGGDHDGHDRGDGRERVPHGRRVDDDGGGAGVGRWPVANI